ncbi:MAG: LysR family transcriptional regulator [Proteobacteria bacterium]|nr:LysR family transcriptional regulator [Pseudomonadota bacterium]
MDSFEDLAFFVQLVQHGSLTALARDRNITPSAVSIRLTKLEKKLGVRLLNRSTRKLSPTHEGEIYFSRGAQLLAEIKDLNQLIASSRTQAKGLLRVNAPQAFGRYRISPLISEFCRLYPDVDVQLELTDNPIDLIEKAFDVSIRFGVPPDSRLIARKIAPCKRILCASPIYLREAGELREPKDLLRHQCLVQQGEGNAGAWLLTRGGEQELVKVKGALSSNDGEAMLTWALMGHGILIRRDWYIKRFIRSGLLQQVLPDWSLPEENIYAVYPERTHLPAKVSVFIEFLARQLTCIHEESMQ